MEVAGDGVNVYADAKGEYTRQLCQYLTPALHKYFLDMLEKAKEGDEKTKYLINFQTLLEGIADWNIDKVQRETQHIAINTQCDYLEELLTAVFIAHTKVLSAIRLTNKNRKLQITIPKMDHFLHRTLRECARHLWTNAFLFSTTGTTFERQKNMREVESLINDGILLGIRTMLPVKSILREYLSTEESDTEQEDEEDEDEDMESKEVPVESKEVPVESKEVPVESKEVPVESKEVPVESKEVPVESKEVPVESKEVPVESKEVPVESKEVPKEEPPILNFEKQEMEFIDTDNLELNDSDNLGGIECDELPA